MKLRLQMLLGVPEQLVINMGAVLFVTGEVTKIVYTNISNIQSRGFELVQKIILLD